MASVDTHRSMTDAFHQIGYCAQDDPHWNMVTLEEHLQCYGAIRGIPKQSIPLVVD